jgi:hypothetical protein
VRTWTSWYRWTTLVLLAHLFLSVATAPERAGSTPAGRITLTLNEIQHNQAKGREHYELLLEH